MKRRALVLFSGGQDSTTCLLWALQRFDVVETIGFDYGQRHRIELDARQLVIKAVREDFSELASRLGSDHVINLSVLGHISDTALTSQTEIQLSESGLPNTFVPGRNIIFLTVAAALAYRRGLEVLVGGMCETDYSGYPDCRDDAIKALQVALNVGMATRLTVETPLMWIDKAETWELAYTLGGAPFIALIKEHTHTCYFGNHVMRHQWGYGCANCPACDLRARGYEHWRSIRKEIGRSDEI